MLAHLSQEQIEDLLDNVIKVDKRKDWKGTKVQFCCPIHGESNPSCGIDYDFHPQDSTGTYQVFNCFSCGAHGNLAWFLYKSLPDEFSSVSQAERFLKNRYKLSGKFIDVNDSLLLNLPDYEKRYSFIDISSERVVKPYSDLAPFKSGIETYKYFFKRGFDKEDMKKFMIGRDLENKTVTIPAFWEDGSLAGIIGRYIDQSRPHNSRFKIYNFNKGALIYPLDKLEVVDDTLIGLESMLDVIMLHKWGYPNAFAVMGDGMTEAQAEMVASRCSKFIDLSDNDKGGSAFSRVAKKALKSRGVQYLVPQYYPDEGKDPCEWGELETVKVISSARSMTQAIKLPRL